MFSSAIISFSIPYLSSVYIDFMTQSEVNCLSIFRLLSQREAREPAFRCFVSAGFLTPCTALNYCLILVQIMPTTGWVHGEYEWDGQWSSLCLLTLPGTKFAELLARTQSIQFLCLMLLWSKYQSTNQKNLAKEPKDYNWMINCPNHKILLE